MTCTVLVLVMNNVQSTNTSITLLMYAKWIKKFMAWDKDLIAQNLQNPSKDTTEGEWVMNIWALSCGAAVSRILLVWVGFKLHIMKQTKQWKEKKNKHCWQRAENILGEKGSLISFFGQKLDEGKNLYKPLLCTCGNHTKKSPER